MQTQLEATLAKLISIPSVSKDTLACNEILAYVRDELKTLGLFIEEKTDTPHPWLIATTQNTKTPDILLAAHLDVVPAAPELFIMQKREGKLYGRGVYDMKLAAACYLELLRAHKNELPRLNIGLLFTTDEELHSNCMRDVMATGLRPKIAFIPDGGDNWAVEQRAKGLYNVELVARGKAAHGSRPWEGENAMHTLLDVIHVLRAKYPSKNPSDSTLMVNRIRAGEAVNQIADYASVMIDFRTFSKKEHGNYRLLIAELAKKHSLEITLNATGEPLELDKNEPNVQKFLQVLGGFRDEQPHFCSSYGASDARFFAEYGIPGIVVEPNGGGRHAESEWLKADDLIEYYKLLEQWLLPSTAAKRANTQVTASIV
jgi:acetylornithine deacetylase/succinyl-diaminopimelate desuccinylase-like protein